MKRRIGVLHLIDSGGLYGAENVVLNLSIGLKNRGHHSAVGCFSYPSKPIPEIAAKARSLDLETVVFVERLRERFSGEAFRHRVDLLVREVVHPCCIIQCLCDSLASLTCRGYLSPD